MVVELSKVPFEKQVDEQHLLELLSAKRVNDGPTYHAPQYLATSAASPRSILLLGSCQAGGWYFHINTHTKTKCDYVLTNAMSQLEPKSVAELADYDLQIIQIPLRSLIPDASFWSLDFSDIEGHKAVFDRAVERLQLFLDARMKYNKESGLLTFVSNFFVPQSNPMGRLLPSFDIRNPQYVITRLNEALESILQGYSNAFVLNVDQISSIYGKKYVQEDHINWFSHGSHLHPVDWDRTRMEHSPPTKLHHDNKLEEHLPAVWAEICAMYRSARQIDQVKMVVVDLDDTLWKGVVGEMDAPGPDIVEGWPLGFAEALCYLKKRGVMLGIISKNDENRIREIWSKIFGGRLLLSDFAVIKINYEPKVSNLADILARVNVLPNSVVYVDDNPVERASMASAYPGLRVLPRFHYYWRRILLWAPETQPALITNESARRTEMMQAQVKREDLKQQMSRGEFLRSLEIKLRLFPVVGEDSAEYKRSIELINKTNQFNTTGVRWPEEQFKASLKSGYKVFAFEVEDNLTNYGLVGVFLTKNSMVEQMVMSCRVVGMEVEVAAVALLVQQLRKSGIKYITSKIVHTKANLLCRDLWQRCGFVEKNNIFDLAEGTDVPYPEHIANVS